MSDTPRTDEAMLPKNYGQHFDGSDGVTAHEAVIDQLSTLSRELERQIAEIRRPNADDEAVPKWVTAWPDHLGIAGNTTVVPLADYERVMMERNDVRLELERQLAEARKEAHLYKEGWNSAMAFYAKEDLSTKVEERFVSALAAIAADPATPE